MENSIHDTQNRSISRSAHLLQQNPAERVRHRVGRRFLNGQKAAAGLGFVFALYVWSPEFGNTILLNVHVDCVISKTNGCSLLTLLVLSAPKASASASAAVRYVHRCVRALQVMLWNDLVAHALLGLDRSKFCSAALVPLARGDVTLKFKQANCHVVAQFDVRAQRQENRTVQQS